MIYCGWQKVSCRRWQHSTLIFTDLIFLSTFCPLLESFLHFYFFLWSAVLKTSHFITGKNILPMIYECLSTFLYYHPVSLLIISREKQQAILKLYFTFLLPFLKVLCLSNDLEHFWDSRKLICGTFKRENDGELITERGEMFPLSPFYFFLIFSLHIGAGLLHGCTA